ncbi:hypothetical protein GCM10010513_36150 [Streptomyces glebosus]|nr:hypothetical protein GCM10010513_36150 [Streptomyces glebosus]
MNTVAGPWVVRAHPSGTFTVNPPPGGDHGTYTWVSGMSPGGFESAGAGAVEDGACGGGEAEEEQAAAPAPAPATSTRPAAAAANGRRMADTSQWGRRLPVAQDFRFSLDARSRPARARAAHG